MTSIAMTERAEDARRIRRMRWMAIGAVAMLLAVPFVAGIITGYAGGSARGVLPWAVAGGLIVSLALAGGAWRLKQQASGPESASTKANHALLAVSGFLGGMIGLALAVTALSGRDRGADVGDAMLSGPLPVWLAVVLAVLWGIVLPIVSWRWERVVDEHEREAYRQGAVAGFYVIGVGAPVWWLLSRAALVPPVDPMGLYIAVLTVTGVVWLWHKYR